MTSNITPEQLREIAKDTCLSLGMSITMERMLKIDDALRSAADQIDHLASSGPAGEKIVTFEGETIKAQAHLIAKLESDLDAVNDSGHKVALLISDLKAQLAAMTARDAQWNEKWKATIDLMMKAQDERDTALQECEAQKARAIRAEAERDEAVQVRIGYDRWLTGGIYYTNEEHRAMIAAYNKPVTPAPDHAGREEA